MVVFLTVPVSSFGKNSLPYGSSVTVALSLILSINLTLTMCFDSSKVHNEIMVKHCPLPRLPVVKQLDIPVKLTDRLAERLKGVWVFCGLHVVGESTRQRRGETVKTVKTLAVFGATFGERLQREPIGHLERLGHFGLV